MFLHAWTNVAYNLTNKRDNHKHSGGMTLTSRISQALSLPKLLLLLLGTAARYYYLIFAIIEINFKSNLLNRFLKRYYHISIQGRFG